MQCKKLSADVYHTLKNSFLIKADFQHIGNRAPKIDVEKLAARMKELGIPDWACRRFRRDREFQILKCRKHQISFLYDSIPKRLQIIWSIEKFEKLFEVSETVIRRAFAADIDDTLEPGRNSKFDDNQEDSKILTEEDDENSMRPKEVVSYVNETYDLKLTKGWLKSFLLRKSENIQRSYSYPQDLKRLNIPRIFFTRHFDIMKAYITGKVSELVFNLDEVGISPLEDKNQKE